MLSRLGLSVQKRGYCQGAGKKRFSGGGEERDRACERVGESRIGALKGGPVQFLCPSIILQRVEGRREGKFSKEGGKSASTPKGRLPRIWEGKNRNAGTRRECIGGGGGGVNDVPNVSRLNPLKKSY